MDDTIYPCASFQNRPSKNSRRNFPYSKSCARLAIYRFCERLPDELHRAEAHVRVAARGARDEEGALHGGRDARRGGAVALGQRPLLLDLTTAAGDDDHVVALFKEGARWGAISKTNHAVLRYRDAVYRDPRELAMSYFNEYFLDSGVKTMRSYSAPFDLLKYGDEWLTSRDDLGDIAADLDYSRHFQIIKKGVERKLRRAERVRSRQGRSWKKKTPPGNRVVVVISGQCAILYKIDNGTNSYDGQSPFGRQWRRRLPALGFCVGIFPYKLCGGSFACSTLRTSFHPKR